jgi:hypothetical protein
VAEPSLGGVTIFGEKEVVTADGRLLAVRDTGAVKPPID